MTEIGHNQPPASAVFALSVDELLATANSVTAITNDEQEAAADEVMREARKLHKDADAIRKAEKQPHMDAAKAVDEEWKPNLSKCDLIVEAMKRALTPYREARQRAKDEAARKAREEAEARQKAAQAALQQSEDLEARFTAEEELKQAQKLTAVASRIDREATGLRTFWEAEIADPRAALNFYIKRSPERFRALVQQMADEDARGARGEVPGVVFHERRRAA